MQFLNRVLAPLILLVSVSNANANVFYDISADYVGGTYAGYVTGTPLNGFVELSSNQDGYYSDNTFGIKVIDYSLASNLVSWSFSDGTRTNSSALGSIFDPYQFAEITINAGAISIAYLMSTSFLVGSPYGYSHSGELHDLAGFGPATFTLRASSVVAVPEPETYALFLAGLGLLGFASRRRQS